MQKCQRQGGFFHGTISRLMLRRFLQHLYTEPLHPNWEGYEYGSAGR
jgi:hypothetical protein